MLPKLILVAGLIAAASATCDFPPRFWCDSKAIASQCGVELACAEQMWVEEKDVKPVKLDLYFESLCPDCMNFIVNMLYPTWKQFLTSKVMILKTYPYGNAHELKGSGGMWNFTCQHGPNECKGNLIENCIQKYTDNKVERYFPIFYCMEASNNPLSAAQDCTTRSGLKWSTIQTCAEGAEGNALMHMSAVATDKLDPPHKYVPWVVLNGVHTDSIQQEAQDNLPKLICDTYKGKKPKICMKYEVGPTDAVTYRDD